MWKTYLYVHEKNDEIHTKQNQKTNEYHTKHQKISYIYIKNINYSLKIKCDANTKLKMYKKWYIYTLNQVKTYKEKL